MARVEEIDFERAGLVSLDESINSAIRTLNAQPSLDWRKHLPRMQRILRSELFLHWTNAAPRLQRMLIGRQPHDVRGLAP